MIALGAIFLYVLTTLYGFYSLFLSKWPSDYSLGNCAFNACVCSYYFVFIMTNTILGTKINSEVCVNGSKSFKMTK